MVIAIVVGGSLSVKEQTILASLQRQSAVLALVKLIAVVRVRVQLQAVRFWTWANISVHRTSRRHFSSCPLYNYKKKKIYIYFNKNWKEKKEKQVMQIANGKSALADEVDTRDTCMQNTKKLVFTPYRKYITWIMVIFAHRDKERALRLPSRNKRARCWTLWKVEQNDISPWTIE